MTWSVIPSADVPAVLEAAKARLCVNLDGRPQRDESSYCIECDPDEPE